MSSAALHLHEPACVEYRPIDRFGVQLNSRQVALEKLSVAYTFLAESERPAYLSEAGQATVHRELPNCTHNAGRGEGEANSPRGKTRFRTSGRSTWRPFRCWSARIQSSQYPVGAHLSAGPSSAHKLRVITHPSPVWQESPP